MTATIPEGMNYKLIVSAPGGRSEHKWFPELDDVLRHMIPMGKNLRLHVEDRDGNLARTHLAAWTEIERRWAEIMSRPLRY